VLDGPAQRALVVNTTSNALTLGSVNNGPGSWDSQAESETRAAPVGTLMDTRTGSRLGQIPLRGTVHLLAVDGQIGHFVAVDATPGAQTVTVIDATRGSSRHLRFTAGLVTPVFVASAVDERRGHLLATTLLSPTTDGLTQDRGVAMFDTHGGRLLHLTTLPPEPALTPAGVASAPSLDCSIAINARAARAFVFSTGGSVSVLDTRTGHLVRTQRLPAALYAATIDQRSGRVFALPNPGVPFCRGGFPRRGTGPAARSVAMLDARTGTLLRLVPVPIIPWALVVDDALNHVIVTGGSSSQVSILDATTGHLVRTIMVGQAGGPVYSRLVAIDRRRHRVIMASAQITPGGLHTRLDVLNARTGALLHTSTLDELAVALAVDERSGHVLVLAVVPSGPPADPWGWLLAGLQRFVPLVPAPPASWSGPPGGHKQAAVVLTVDPLR
jgi:DNA-binding beta-propeller fold protein YncE